MRILIELPSWLGDAVMVTPAIENLINFHKKSEIILIGPAISIEVFKNHPKVSNIYTLDKKYYLLYLLAIELGKFDKYFSFRNSIRSNIFKFFIKSKLKFIYKRKGLQNLHQVEKYNEFINRSLKTSYPTGSLSIYSESFLKKSFTNKTKNKPMLGISPGASFGDAKRWYPEEFAIVAAALSNQYDVTILGGPNEAEIAMDIEKLLLKKGVTNYQNLVGTTNISELIHLISNFDLFITGDSGPMHIAASFQVPTVSIFGPTQSEETSQWNNQKSIVLKKNLDCQPCMKRVCPLKHHNCMKMIKAKDVIQEVESFNL
jgi:heptosyltransferase II